MTDKEPIEHLIEGARIQGASRVISHDLPAKVTAEEAGQVIALIREFCTRTGRKYAQVVRSLGISSPMLSDVLAMKYHGDWRSVIIDLDRWLEDELKREQAPRPTEFVWTKVAEEILTVAEAAIVLKCIGLIYDRYGSGVGKTLALQAIAADKPGAILISIETANAMPRGVLRLIAKALLLPIAPNATAGTIFAALKKALSGTGRLLLIDEIHKLCSGHEDNSLHVLRDLHDATGIPMLFCGTNDLVAYLERKVAGGREPLAQIRRRIGIARDLRERTGDGTSPGDPLFSVEEIRKVFARSKMRLTPDAARYLCLLANLPDSGGLGTCRNLVVMATKINESRGDVLTADMLRAVHRLLVNRAVFELLENRMEERLRPMARTA